MKDYVQESIANLKFFVERLNFLHKVSQKISERKPLSRLLNEILEESKVVMEAEASSLMLFDPEDKHLYFQVATGSKGKAVKRRTVRLGEGIAGWVAKHKQPLLIDDCYKDKRFDASHDEKLKYTTRNMICVPLMRKKKLLGIMQAINKKNDGTFTQQDLHIFETLASQCAIAIENAGLIEAQIQTEALERELETARTIQQALLQQIPEYDDLDAAAQLIPAKHVGGDYYNITRLNRRESLFLVADVSGKGIPAALIVSTICSCMQTFLKITKSFDLKRFVGSLNKVLIDSTTMDKFVTCWIGLYDHENRTLSSVNAGHNPPYLFRKNGKLPETLETGGLFLGTMDISFEIESVKLNAGDVLVFYSDGITEAFNNKEEEYGDEALIRMVTGKRQESAREILDAVVSDVRRHAGRATQSDDLTCGVIKVL
ncbi:SpoIIE family protein phosphatase [candidate division KSB1 bacterium]|nr:SpoIIE family protein phosphatase [candidate division KSB1 bacterium]